MEPEKRSWGWVLVGVAIAAFVGALVTFLIWESRAILLTAIVVEAVALVALLVLTFWPAAEFQAPDVNPRLVRCPRCSSVFEPPRRGEEMVCPTCGLTGRPPSKEAPA